MMLTHIRAHILATPDPLQWDCFSFECIQRADHFTFFKAALTPESPQVRTWTEFARSNDAASRCEFALVSCEM
jgi:hypothetical protein